MRMKSYLMSPKLHIYSYINRRFRNLLSDKCYLKVLYYLKTGKDINLKKPKGYREKIQWMKLYNRNPHYTLLVDKYIVKKYVAKAIGEEHVIPTLAVYHNTDEIDIDALPSQFVLKCNHNSHIGLCICSNKEKFNWSYAIDFLNQGMNDDYYARSREWAYKDVQRRIIAEKYIEDATEPGNVLTDYKFFCFNGKAKIMYISHDIAKDPRTDFFDMEFNHLDIHMQDRNADIIPTKPAFFDEMRVSAEKLSSGIPFVRVDFYIAEGTYYFGEMTFYPSSGLAEVHPGEWDEIIGSWIDLSNVRMQEPQIVKSEAQEDNEYRNQRINGGGYFKTPSYPRLAA